MATAFNTAASDLQQIQLGLDSGINADVGQINSYASQIAGLNNQIATSIAQGVSPNSLLDQRYQAVNNLSQLVNVQTQQGTAGSLTVIVGGAVLVGANAAQTLTVGSDQSGNATDQCERFQPPLSISGGDLGGLLSQRNQTLADFQNRLDTLARQVATSFNSVQSTGLGVAGGFSNLTSQNGVSDTTVPLNAAGLVFPVHSRFAIHRCDEHGHRAAARLPRCRSILNRIRCRMSRTRSRPPFRTCRRL